MSGFRAVIFDLDGTLVDSWAIHVRCLRAGCAAAISRKPGSTELSGAALLAAQRGTDLETLRVLAGEQRAEQALAAYQDALRAELTRAPVPPMPGASEVLSELRRAGIAVGVCTGRSREGALALIRSSGLAVPLLAAREDAALPKPAPDGLRHALAVLDLPQADALYVGDAKFDAESGARAGVETLLVSPGTLSTVTARIGVLT